MTLSEQSYSNTPAAPNNRYDADSWNQKTVKMLQPEEKQMPSNIKNYHQIYSSALHEMREQARR